jgi:outer membrane protein
VRPAYTASGGYSGSHITFSLSKRFPRYAVADFMRYDSLAGAVFDDTQLAKKRDGVSAGIAVAWGFKQSSRLAHVEE